MPKNTLELKVICYIDSRCKKRMGNWEDLISNIIGSTSILLSRLLEISINLKLIRVLSCEMIDTSGLNSEWRSDSGLRKRVKKDYGLDFRLRELFLMEAVLREFKSWIFETDFSEFGESRFENYIHIGFFDLYKANGGGIAGFDDEGNKLPILIVHRNRSLDEYIHTASHELLHTMGARHSRHGIMRPSYPINPTFLDKRNKDLIRSKILRNINSKP